MKHIIILLLFGLSVQTQCIQIYKNLGHVNVNELFLNKIVPQTFNWTINWPNKFQLRASLKDHPELPTWMQFTYSQEYFVGYL